MGPTASGKTAAALHLAQHFAVEIINVDSALVYRGMDIGTAKPDLATRATVPHHLIDIIDPTQSYSAARFRDEALAAMAKITAAGKIPLLVGGTMLYFKAIREGLSVLPMADASLRAEIEQRAAQLGWPHLHRELAAVDPETAARLDPNDAQRIQRALEVCRLSGISMSSLLRQRVEPDLPYHFICIALEPSDRSQLHGRIAQRLDQMLKLGLVEEVRGLRARYALHPALPAMRAVGYRQVWAHLEGEFDLLTLRDKAIAATRQLAKRQLTWLRAMTEVKRLDCLGTDLNDRVHERVAVALASHQSATS